MALYRHIGGAHHCDRASLTADVQLDKVLRRAGVRKHLGRRGGLRRVPKVALPVEGPPGMCILVPVVASRLGATRGFFRLPLLLLLLLLYMRTQQQWRCRLDDCRMYCRAVPSVWQGLQGSLTRNIMLAATASYSTWHSDVNVSECLPPEQADPKLTVHANAKQFCEPSSRQRASPGAAPPATCAGCPH